MHFLRYEASMCGSILLAALFVFLSQSSSTSCFGCWLPLPRYEIYGFIQQLSASTSLVRQWVQPVVRTNSFAHWQRDTNDEHLSGNDRTQTIKHSNKLESIRRPHSWPVITVALSIGHRAVSRCHWFYSTHTHSENRFEAIYYRVWWVSDNRSSRSGGCVADWTRVSDRLKNKNKNTFVTQAQKSQCHCSFNCSCLLSTLGSSRHCNLRTRWSTYVFAYIFQRRLMSSLHVSINSPPTMKKKKHAVFFMSMQFTLWVFFLSLTHSFPLGFHCWRRRRHSNTIY